MLPLPARKKKDVPAPPPAPKVEKPAPVRQGLFGVQHQKDDWFFFVPDSLLGRPFLVTTRFVSTPVGLGVHGGELANSQVLYWERRSGNLLLRALMYDSRVDSTAAIARAVAQSAEDPILANLKIEHQAAASTPADSTAQHAPQPLGHRSYRVKVTDLFRMDNPAVGFAPSAKTRFSISAMRPELSYIDTIKTFPINTEISTVKTFTAKTESRVPSASATGLLTFRLNTSFVLLPKEPMRARSFDPRVGYFTESFVDYSDTQQSVRRRAVATRWRLEPRPEDVEKMRRGELVEPQKPIVFYIDPATPKQWRKYLIMGVNDWQKAFEQAGFKNAIYALEWPDDSTMSLEDARFSVIRYLASPVANAYGPHVSDPRSGEIIESHIGWYHNVMQLVHDWYMVQAGAVDERARKMQFDEELMGQLIRFVSSHEVGHTLGLRHNMGSSSRTPVEQLRNKPWVEAHGHTASIMDYARFNYVAQPEDKIGDDGIFPRINDYDQWAIRWGYTFFPDAKSEQEERLALNRLTIEALKNPRLWFGGEGHDNDPCAQTEDLGDDAMKASSYGLKNLRRVVRALPEWTHEEGDLGENLEQVYGNAVAQFRRYIGHVCRNIGGVHHEYKSVEQPGPVYTPMTRERQKRALRWLADNVIAEPRWMIAEPYVARLSKTPQELIRPLAETAVANLVSPTTLDRMARNAEVARPAYTLSEYTTDLLNTLFPETTTQAAVGSWKRFVQKEAVLRLLKSWKMLPESEAHGHTTDLLRRIRSRVLAARPADADTRVHYADLARQIQMAFEGK